MIIKHEYKEEKKLIIRFKDLRVGDHFRIDVDYISPDCRKKVIGNRHYVKTGNACGDHVKNAFKLSDEERMTYIAPDTVVKKLDVYLVVKEIVDE